MNLITVYGIGCLALGVGLDRLWNYAWRKSRNDTTGENQ